MRRIFQVFILKGLKGIYDGWGNMVNSMSVEIKSKIYVKNVTISNDAHDRVLFVAELGDLVELSLVDDEVLEYRGTTGTLRVDLKKDSLIELLSKTKTNAPGSDSRSLTNSEKKGERKIEKK